MPGAISLGNSLPRPGVYWGVFEQSVFLAAPSNQRWAALLSLTAELMMLVLAILIPLSYTDRLPLAHWKSAGIASPPARQVDIRPVGAGHSRGNSILTALPRVFVYRQSERPAIQLDITAEPPVDYIDVVSNAAGGMESNGIWTTITALTNKPPAPQPKASQAQSPSGPVRVSQGVQMAKLLRQVKPEYPALAKTARIYGAVHLLGVIGKDGTVQNLQVISGHPLLARAALDAVRQWIYKPTLLNGEPVEVRAPIEVNFTLTQ